MTVFLKSNGSQNRAFCYATETSLSGRPFNFADVLGLVLILFSGDGRLRKHFDKLIKK
jgi:hypothetical protein